MDWPLMAKTSLFVTGGSVILFCFLVFGAGSIVLIMAMKVNQAQEKHPLWQSWFWRATIHVIDALFSLSALSYLFAFLFMFCYALLFVGKPLPFARQELFLLYLSAIWLIRTYWLERRILGEAIRSMTQVERENWPATKQSWRKVIDRFKSLS